MYMDKNKKKELIQTSLLLIIIIAVSVLLVRNLAEGETLSDYRVRIESNDSAS